MGKTHLLVSATNFPTGFIVFCPFFQKFMTCIGFFNPSNSQPIKLRRPHDSLGTAKRSDSFRTCRTSILSRRHSGVPWKMAKPLLSPSRRSVQFLSIFTPKTSILYGKMKEKNLASDSSSFLHLASFFFCIFDAGFLGRRDGRHTAHSAHISQFAGILGELGRSNSVKRFQRKRNAAPGARTSLQERASQDGRRKSLGIPRIWAELQRRCSRAREVGAKDNPSGASSDEFVSDVDCFCWVF